jgi:hypothetical protein
MKDESALQLVEFHHLSVQLGSDIGLPEFGDLGKFFGDVDFVHDSLAVEASLDFTRKQRPQRTQAMAGAGLRGDLPLRLKDGFVRDDGVRKDSTMIKGVSKKRPATVCGSFVS